MDNNGFVLAPLPVAPVNKADTVLLPEGLNTLKRVARLTGLKIDGSYLNLDGGFDSRRNRKAIFNAGLIPNINENPRNRKTSKRGRKRLFNAAIHSLRLCVERTFAWEDKFKRLLLRFEFKQQRHYGMKLMAYTMINLRHFVVPETRNQLDVTTTLGHEHLLHPGCRRGFGNSFGAHARFPYRPGASPLAGMVPRFQPRHTR